MSFFSFIDLYFLHRLLHLKYVRFLYNAIVFIHTYRLLHFIILFHCTDLFWENIWWFPSENAHLSTGLLIYFFICLEVLSFWIFDIRLWFGRLLLIYIIYIGQISFLVFSKIPTSVGRLRRVLNLFIPISLLFVNEFIIGYK